MSTRQLCVSVEDSDALLLDAGSTASLDIIIHPGVHHGVPSSYAKDRTKRWGGHQWSLKTQQSAGGSGNSETTTRTRIAPPSTIEKCVPQQQLAPIYLPDLIELASSSSEEESEFSLGRSNSSASDYRSCDEVDDPQSHIHQPPLSTGTSIGRPSHRSVGTIAVMDSVTCAGGHDDDLSFSHSEVAATPEEELEPFVIGLRYAQYPSAAQLSVTSSNSDPTLPVCRICHLPAGDDDTLISPCRCAGTMQYIHNGCLMKWLEVSNRKSKRPPSCELCLYQYHRHKKFKVRHWQFPQCSLRDKIMHAVFFLSLLTMIGAATVTILCFKHDKGGRVSLDKNRLTHSEIVTLVCGVLFFIAFFLAMYVEVKARSTIYKLIVDFLYLNQQWYIDEYDKKTDVQSVSV